MGLTYSVWNDRLRKRIPECIGNATGDSMKEGFRTELCDPKTMVSRLQFLNMQDSGTVMEPKTGVHFPLHLSCDEFQENMSCQVTKFGKHLI